MAEKIINPHPKVTRENYCKNTKQELKCEECGRAFVSIRRGHKFCSWECSRKYIKRTKPFTPRKVKCGLCGKEFSQKTVWQRWCSQGCRDKWHRNPAARKGVRECLICGKEFSPKNSWRERYCSEECVRVKFCKSSEAYRERNGSKGLCKNCKRPKLPHSSYLCEEHWFNRAARTNGLVDRNAGILLKKLIEKQNYTCPYTGRKLIPGINASIDHIKPKSRFPKEAFLIENLEWIDININTSKGEMTKTEFVELCKEVAARF